MKYVFITGGVVSGLGKGITAASIGRLLINRGFRVNVQKHDVYLNADTGNMNPLRHGEAFITDDGAETDLDIGHYERFMGRHLNKTSNSTMGKIYSSILAKERNGEFCGKDVQVVPHITDEIKNVLREAGKDADIVLIELGGTVGDIESMVVVEALRQFRQELGPQGSVSVHLTLVPKLESSGEVKTKPTQHSVQTLNRMGIYPDIIVCRTNADVELDRELREKIVMFCNLGSIDDVIHAKDCKSIYEVPIHLKNQKLDDIILKKLGLKAPKDNLADWKKMVENMYKTNGQKKTIGIIGEYAQASDAYLSVIEAVKAASLATGVHTQIVLATEPNKFDAIIAHGAPGAASEYARVNNIPFLGVGSHPSAPHTPGLQTVVPTNTLAYAKERFRTRDTTKPDIITLDNHPFHVTTQFHPEFLSKPYHAHPLFIKLLESI